MTSEAMIMKHFPAGCSIVRHHGKPDSRWHLRSLDGTSIIAALDLWTVLKGAHDSHFEQALVNDDGALYLLKITQIE